MTRPKSEPDVIKRSVVRLRLSEKSDMDVDEGIRNDRW